MSSSDILQSRFVQKVFHLLETVSYFRAQTRDEHELIYRLRYDGNLREGTIDPNETGQLADEYDELPSCFNLGVRFDGKLGAALRLHLLTRDTPKSVLVGAYPDIVPELVQSGAVIIDVTRLVADFDMARTRPGLPYVTVRLAMAAAEHFNADFLLAAVRREHIPFYRREFMARQLCEPRPYPTLVKPLALFCIDFRNDFDAIAARHPFYRSSASERATLFGDPLTQVHDTTSAGYKLA